MRARWGLTRLSSQEEKNEVPVGNCLQLPLVTRQLKGEMLVPLEAALERNCAVDNTKKNTEAGLDWEIG
jgi:hypothetical protein